MDSIHFKTDFSMKKKCIFCLHFLQSPTIYSLKTVQYLLSFEAFNVLIWFILTVLQESSNLDAIFIVCRKIKNKISKLVFSPTPPPFLVKSQLFDFFSTLPLVDTKIQTRESISDQYQQEDSFGDD